ncbi:cytochrome b5 domain-containing protein [Anaerocolumna xylanovorans]|uniref:cytochrome b5 domain-containing protein n=1 Tax=Anaerocolumna xylanovorans TaxID=100134 RepID=UPI001FA87519|nr:cytochrome b5 domain-containing protein [Anaerocolumna xylanovorans]
MESNEIRNKLNNYQKEIIHYSQMQTFSRNLYEKNYYQGLMQNRTDNFAAELEEMLLSESLAENDTEDRVFTLSELSYFDGSEGRPAYVAVNGKVYDVSNIAAWGGGTHFAGLRAGNDLSGQFASCHRGMAAMLDQLPVVGTIALEE